MKIEMIDRVIAECKRFCEVASLAQKRLRREAASEAASGDGCLATKEVAACRRASMDLSRALAELRKP